MRREEMKDEETKVKKQQQKKEVQSKLGEDKEMGHFCFSLDLVSVVPPCREQAPSGIKGGERLMS